MRRAGQIDHHLPHIFDSLLHVLRQARPGPSICGMATPKPGKPSDRNWPLGVLPASIAKCQPHGTGSPKDRLCGLMPSITATHLAYASVNTSTASTAAIAGACMPIPFPPRIKPNGRQPSYAAGLSII
jgi:hypothetical protein|tara:strand:- start:1489 stop:1872 length:384 start_codon:yes stop_codon:yes gene_type:complete